MPHLVPPLADRCQVCGAGCWVSPPEQCRSWHTNGASIISASAAQVGTGKLEQSLWSLQGLLNTGLSQSQTQGSHCPLETLHAQMLSLATMVLAALGKTYKLCSKTYL